MLNADQILAAAERLKECRIDDNSIDRRVAFGVRGVDGGTPYAWLVIEREGDHATKVETHFVDGNITADDHFKAHITVAADAEEWLAIADSGHPRLLTACDRGAVVIGGNLPYFIRNVRSAMNVIVHCAQALRG